MIYINKPTQFKRVIVPTPSYVTNQYYSQQHIKLFDHVAEAAISEIVVAQEQFPEKIYFTRQAFKKAVSSEVGEEILIDLFSRNGFEIIAPEKHDLKTQIAYIRNAKVVAGIAGSIPHNMLFAKPGQKIIIINKACIVNMMQMDINFMRNLNVDYIDAYAGMIPVRLGHGPFLFTETKELKQYCIDNNLDEIDARYRSQKYNKKVINQYTNLIYRAPPYKSLSTQNKNSVHYYNPAISLQFLNKFYKNICYYPWWLRFKNIIGRVLRKIKRMIKR